MQRLDTARVIIVLGDQAMTLSQISFYAGMHPSRAKLALDRLVSGGVAKKTRGPIRWGGRGNGTAFTVEQEATLYQMRDVAREAIA